MIDQGVIQDFEVEGGNKACMLLKINQNILLKKEVNCYFNTLLVHAV